ncbi:Hypothetical protein PENO1_040590 [Penicillium occitanis (nom. inval.)]|nr:hypothetical protein PENOC_086840 [Penicillium occitanis (nom. inval.)]PCH01921.1 Hypothetical protein PENO1_040590 [Penicillium occitanis (nom. inval.)]
MAHQTHNIRWDALTSCLKVYSPDVPIKEKPINLYLRFDNDQDKNISQFVTSFVDNIKEHTACERKKHPATFDIPNKNDLILGDAVTKKITPLVHRWRQSHGWDLSTKSHDKKKPLPSLLPKLCTHGDDKAAAAEEGFGCRCVLPLHERKASAFLRQYCPNDCREFYDKNGAAFYNIEVVKTLILYGEMEPILRGCDLGWDTIYEAALNTYLTLNILYSFPALWDPASSSTSRNRRTDYRSTKLYQMMLRTCTWSGGTSEISKYPHRAFFGIGDHQFRSWPCLDPVFSYRYNDSRSSDEIGFGRVEFPYGVASIAELLNAEKHDTGYLPDVAAVAFVRNVLYSNRLPTELVDDVMDKADYTVKRSLVHPHDPFHGGNAEELRKYLTFCWRVMVDCNMMADALGVRIGWERLICRILQEQISSLGGRKIRVPDIKD